MTSNPSARTPEPPGLSYKGTSTLGKLKILGQPTNLIMISEQQLRASSETFFDAFSSNKPPNKMLSFFSNTAPVIIQHAPASCPHPHTSRLNGSNAIRSYFDLLATHWTRSDAKIRSPLQVDTNNRRVTLAASVTWMWRKSGRKFVEEFTWTLDYDEGLKLFSFVIRTVSGPGTCVMRAIDSEPVMQEKSPAQASVSSQAPEL
ncbi:hypothetical protein GALMADRAFT_238865 [Galerina marginata CBS 339.88]|uniref:SnoaL-like domain-containing protein n=1 Tax=Galerina marginata (strain CBS 339.88) TaxID=685588 RepID=A0A067TVQ2_GALM3|nr:hypothetical protein GALMADRAFT_238865 [Galerina marginata CBS 339.88]